MCSDFLKSYYKDTRFVCDENIWPPEQPRHFTSLTLIHYKSGHTRREVLTISEADQGNCHYKKASKDISEILTTSNVNEERPHAILIEGSPGTGKTVLSKELSFQWAKGTLPVLCNCVLLFLLPLRDPNIKKITSFEDLIKYFYHFDSEATSIAKSCADYLLKSNGSKVTFLFDGYDEFSEQLRNDSFISTIISKRRLSSCTVLITSRPHASANLHKNMDRLIDILGFTVEDRRAFINESLKEQPQKIEEIVKYLDCHPTINGLCFIPFNVTVLLFLYKIGTVLPKSSTELYNYFICSTISHHLTKVDSSFITREITDINHFPKPYGQVIEGLSKLSLEALHKKQLTFTIEEVEVECPTIRQVPGAIDGFGLLRTVQHFSSKKKAATYSLDFIHFSVQEFFAAYHFAKLPKKEQLELFKLHFWSHFYSNMFAMYVWYTKGQQPAFKQFLFKDSKNIVVDYLQDKLKCLSMFKCFHEANDEDMCAKICQAEIFAEQEIVFRHTPLYSNDLECLNLFLPSRTAWKMLDLSYCGVGDMGMQLLHQSLSSQTDLDALKLQGNALTSSSSSIIGKIISSDKIKTLNLCENFINDNAVQAIIQALNTNTSLETLSLHDNPISVNTVEDLVQAFIERKSSLLLELPTGYTSQVKKGILEKVIEHNKMRQEQKNFKSLNIIFGKSIL